MICHCGIYMLLCYSFSHKIMKMTTTCYDVGHELELFSLDSIAEG